MGKKKGDENPKPSENEEGRNLLGSPKFKKLENGRFKCVETGHELPAHARDSYADSKHCRLGLIDSALSRNKPPLNMFQQDPVSRSKLICRLTGDTINKSEEHIWKHINGKRFLNMLEKKEAENEIPNGTIMEQDKVKEKKKKQKNADGGLIKKKKKTVKEEKPVEEIINEVRDSTEKSSDSEKEADFWMPPAGERWDHDDGGERWGSDSDTDEAAEEGAEDEEVMHEAAELSKKAKRMSLEIGPSSFASRKKKKKTNVDNV
ncbi:hypothetical protein ABFS82_08G002300 [Erythranthe guttata]|uniref:Surfeit locus protein 2 n=1 Tax=Erythranthe guttata TaxID=4155 RepID=A0A022RYS8_ERYGU|nr:PREDICTED: surfeit locus protein 2 [Erythranthe guttata]EYU44853.1 hypothetical protein MIMGU_mgv1a012110mg [Erythranthe guttata]|eukprot:XP_012850426.1 PREDICTED: surfeit locus protein 2 [Erythranthe guttata]